MKDNYSLEEYVIYNNEETMERLNERILKVVENNEDDNFRKIAVLRYGLEDRNPLTIKELSKELNIPVSTIKDYVVQVEKKVFNMLKKDILD